jgi:uncharacterized protein (DUF1778 family)
MPAAASHSKPVNIRIRDDIRALIDRAAEIQGKSRSEFMVDAARRAAEDTVLDQSVFRLSEADHAAFAKILDNPPPAGAKLKKLMAAKPVWETN